MLKENSKILENLSTSLARLGYNGLSAKVASIAKTAGIEVSVSSSGSGVDEVWRTLIENPGQIVTMNWSGSVYDNHFIKWNKDQTDLLWTENEWWSDNEDYKSVMNDSSTEYSTVYSMLREKIRKWNEEGGYLSLLSSAQRAETGSYSNGPVTYTLAENGIVYKNGNAMTLIESVLWRKRNLSKDDGSPTGNFKLQETTEQRELRERISVAQLKEAMDRNPNVFYKTVYQKEGAIFLFIPEGDTLSLEYISDLNRILQEGSVTTYKGSEEAGAKAIIRAAYTIFEVEKTMDSVSGTETISLRQQPKVTSAALPEQVEPKRAKPDYPDDAGDANAGDGNIPGGNDDSSNPGEDEANDQILSKARLGKSKRLARIRKMAKKVAIASLSSMTPAQLAALGRALRAASSSGTGTGTGTGSSAGSNRIGPWIEVQNLIKDLNRAKGNQLTLSGRAYEDGYWGPSTASAYNRLTGEAESDSLSRSEISRIRAKLIQELRTPETPEATPDAARTQIGAERKETLLKYLLLDPDDESGVTEAALANRNQFLEGNVQDYQSAEDEVKEAWRKQAPYWSANFQRDKRRFFEFLMQHYGTLLNEAYEKDGGDRGVGMFLINTSVGEARERVTDNGYPIAKYKTADYYYAQTEGGHFVFQTWSNAIKGYDVWITKDPITGTPVDDQTDIIPIQAATDRDEKTLTKKERKALRVNYRRLLAGKEVDGQESQESADLSGRERRIRRRRERLERRLQRNQNRIDNPQ